MRILVCISIHAPTRGATSARRPESYRLLYFNPRSHEGSDQYCNIAFHPVTQFQSTLPRGERLHSDCNLAIQLLISIHAPTRGATTYKPVCYWSKYYFNPRSHEGSDSATPPTPLYRIISIHAPTRGATVLFVFLLHQLAISIHAPTRGATAIFPKFYTLLLSKITNFIFTLHHLFITET